MQFCRVMLMQSLALVGKFCLSVHLSVTLVHSLSKRFIMIRRILTQMIKFRVTRKPAETFNSEM